MRFPFFLRPDQTKALQLLCSNDHLIHIAPTGSGKSIIFQKFIFDHPRIRTVLISPLNALSRQQEERFKKLGISVFNRSCPKSGESGVWIMSPEKVQGRTLEEVRQWSPQFLIVDEAHCIWEWGVRFRPAYMQILDLVKLPSIQKSLWCSATLPAAFQQELFRHLSEMEGARVEKSGAFGMSENILLRREKIAPEIRLFWLRNFLGFHADQSGMIFCNTRAAAVNLQAQLHFWGINSFYYHAGLSVEEKLNLEKKLKEQSDLSAPVVVVATSAFGMGMDYSFFRFCILFEPPFTILSLVQAIGRVGRNASGSKVHAHVLWHPSDFARNRSWVDQSEIYEWCRTLENPVRSLENYFNDSRLSGTMKVDVRTSNNTN